MWQEIEKYGKKLVAYGLNHSHFGNISIRRGDTLLITRSGCLLDEINEQMLVEVNIQKGNAANASSETIVHRQIYIKTPAQAVVHVHSPFATIESMLTNSRVIFSDDTESKSFMREIPIIAGEAGSQELAEEVANALVDHKAAITKGHGIFAAGASLEQAYIYTCSVEHICQLKYFCDLKTFLIKGVR
ncbi:MAG TPA: fuculose phosphate aldolase [Desulfotomaculum sp.]|nr:fuculose phosphate aldolase [Desulfotomaculum sp.]